MADVERWLQDLGLAQYARTFAENDIDLEVLPHLSEQDLEKLGRLARPSQEAAARDRRACSRDRRLPRAARDRRTRNHHNRAPKPSGGS